MWSLITGRAGGGGGGATKREGRASEVLTLQKKGGGGGRTSFSHAEGEHNKLLGSLNTEA